jgi:hypothetical protein
MLTDSLTGAIFKAMTTLVEHLNCAGACDAADVSDEA